MDTAKANAEECFHLGFQHPKPCTDILRSLGVLPLSLLPDPYRCALEGEKKKKVHILKDRMGDRETWLAQNRLSCQLLFPKQCPLMCLSSYRLSFRLGRKMGHNFETKEGFILHHSRP